MLLSSAIDPKFLRFSAGKGLKSFDAFYDSSSPLLVLLASCETVSFEGLFSPSPAKVICKFPSLFAASSLQT